MDATLRQIEALIAGRRVMVVGVGNTLCADDGVGPHVVGRLAREHPAAVLDAGSVPENHVGPIAAAAPEIVLFVDAADHGGAPGSCRLAPVGDLAPRTASTHAASLRLVSLLLESHGPRCWLVGIQPASLEPGAPLSETVRAAGERLAAALARALGREAAHA
jgi:hydrogenase maturation protease